VEARNIPPGTSVRLYIYSENSPGQQVDTTPLAGTPALSTATASIVLPPGFSQGYVCATWAPDGPAGEPGEVADTGPERR